MCTKFENDKLYKANCKEERAFICKTKPKKQTEKTSTHSSFKTLPNTDTSADTATKCAEEESVKCAEYKDKLKPTVSQWDQREITCSIGQYKIDNLRKFNALVSATKGKTLVFWVHPESAYGKGFAKGGSGDCVTFDSTTSLMNKVPCSGKFKGLCEVEVNTKLVIGGDDTAQGSNQGFQVQNISPNYELAEAELPVFLGTVFDENGNPVIITTEAPKTTARPANWVFNDDYQVWEDVNHDNHFDYSDLNWG